MKRHYPQVFKKHPKLQITHPFLFKLDTFLNPQPKYIVLLPLMTTQFADVILPLSLPKNYTYRVPRHLTNALTVGQRVLVPLGKRRFYAGLVYKIHENAPENYTAKYIEAVLDEYPIITNKQLKFWEWIASYYMSNLGEVYTAALPSGFRLDSETKVVLNPSSPLDTAKCTDHEILIIDALEMREVLSLQDVSDILDIKTVFPVLNRLVQKGLILTKEELSERYKPKTCDVVYAAIDFNNEALVKNAFEKLQRAHKQEELLMHFLKESSAFDSTIKGVVKSELLQGANASLASLKSLVDKGILRIETEAVSRLKTVEEKANQGVSLSEDQDAAYQAISTSFEHKKPALLHGVTGSGKTEVYIKLIEDSLKQGKQVLYLLPEIALTSQIIHRLQRYFGNQVAVFHSRFNQNERVEVWQRLAGGKDDSTFKIILGARSALFMPFTNLGLVIVDEEHESTFKQFDPAPRYQARDASIVLAKMHNANIVLGSATPSIESYQNALQNKYTLVELTKRFSGVQLPEIRIANMAEAQKKEAIRENLSPQLFQAIEETLAKGEQVILFQNRRGFSPFVQCNTCGWTPECNHCDITLTYHKYKHLLICHYCGYKADMPKQCSACGSSDLELKGIGTEMVEESLSLLFPDATVARMDLDTTSGKNAHENLIERFENKQVNILVGTQMVTKGLDFDNVGLVGVISADQLLQFPHFRAHERAYQLISQVAGRAGRQAKRGLVIVQAYKPDHHILKMVQHNDYLAMFKQQLEERSTFDYPPHKRMIMVQLKDKDALKCAKGAYFLSELLRKKLGYRVLGPEKPVVGRINNYYIQQILIKLEPKLDLHKVKEFIDLCIIDTKSNSSFRSIRINPDVDPQ